MELSKREAHQSRYGRSRINKYDFIEGVDFIRVAKNGVGTNQGFQAIEYTITVTMS